MTTSRRIVPGGMRAPAVMGDRRDDGPGQQVRQLAARVAVMDVTPCSTDSDTPTPLLPSDPMRSSAVVMPDPDGTSGTTVKIGTNATDPDKWFPLAVGQSYTHQSGAALYAFADAPIDVHTADERH